jgi:CDP-glycerol glycerophosphotransferase (TagB/SpsB family)
MKKILESVIIKSFALLDVFFTRKKYIVFSSRAAKDYADNSKFLYEKFLSEKVDNVYYYTKKKAVLKRIPRNGIYAYSIKGLYVLLQAKILVFTHGSKDFFPYSPNKSSKRVLINLFHAIAVKKLGHSNDKNKLKETRKWNYFVVSSPFEADFIKHQYSLTDNQILIFGQPRNDILINDKKQLIEGKDKIILYAPTFRETSITNLFPFLDRNLRKLDAFLKRNNMKIMIRLHINEEKKYRDSSQYKNLTNISFSGSAEHPSVNDLLPIVDAVITDYSSIALDFLLVNRPIAYIPYDYEKYKEERGFSFDYFKYLPGEVLCTQSELEEFLKMKEDKYLDKRLVLKSFFHKYQDGKSSDRLYKFIINI